MTETTATGLLHPDGPGGMRGQHAVVTGGARGIGAEVALELTRAGASVTIVDVGDLSEVDSRIGAEGGDVEVFNADVRDAGALEAAFARLKRVDAVVTSAAVYGEHADIESLDLSEVSDLLDINVKGTLWTIKAALPRLRETRGRLVCVGSVAGKVGGVLAGPHYVASKGGIHALVKWVAKTEASHGVTANAVAPGVVDTSMVAGRGYDPGYCPLGRFAQPQEVARVIAFLASPASSYMTGAVVDVNGGSAM